MTTTTATTKLLRAFHAICASKGMKPYEKRTILDSYGVESSTELSGWQLNEIIAKLNADEANEGNKWRRRVMASIGGYLKLTGGVNKAAYIFAMALQATGCEYSHFNKIPIKRLQNLYYHFLQKQKDFKAAQNLPTGAELLQMDLQQLEATMQRALSVENYELCDKIKKQINNLKNEML